MRKLGLLLSTVAVVAWMGLAPQALALTDPSCDGDPYPNDPLIHDLTVWTPDSAAEHQVSGVQGSGLACGTDIGWPSTGQGTIYDHADVLTPRGVEVNGTAGIASGRFVGTSVVNVATHVATFPVVLEDNASTLTIDSIANCAAEGVVSHTGHPSGTIIACYRGENPLGYNRNWVTVDPAGRKSLTIGPFHPTTGIAGLTHIKQFNLCAYVGVAGGSQYPADCGGTSEPWLQKNGHGASDLCATGNGIYTATATMRNGTTTPAATTCAPWLAVRWPPLYTARSLRAS